MSRKFGVNKVQLQSYVLLPENINDYFSNSSSKLTISENRERIVVNQNASKESVFDFDHIFPIELSAETSEESSNSAELMNSDLIRLPFDLTPILSNAIELVLLGYSSTLLCYSSQQSTPLRNSKEVPSSSGLSSNPLPLWINKDPFTQLLLEISKTLFSLMKERSAVQYASQQSSVEYEVEISAFELFDTQFRDLLPSITSKDSSLAVPIFHNERVKIKEDSKQAGKLFNIDGINVFQCESEESMVDVLKSILQRRLLMMVRKVEEKSNVGMSKLTSIKPSTNTLDELCNHAGYVGTTMIQILLHSYQTINLPTAQKDQNHHHRIHHQSSLNILWLPTTESLISMMDQYNNLAPPSYCCISDWSHIIAGKFDWLSSSSAAVKPSASENQGGGNEYQLRYQQLKSSLKALSTLIRVITLLVERKNKLAADQGIVSSNKKLPHIPYRDSSLTRLLKNILDGNCFLSMITMLSITSFGSSTSDRKSTDTSVSLNIENVAHALRFTSEIRKLYNYIWIEEKILWKKEDLLPLLMTSQSSSALLPIESSEESSSSEDRANELIRSQEQFRAEMEQMIVELESLEKMRNQLMENMSKMIAFEPVKSNGGGKRSGMSGGDEIDGIEDGSTNSLRQFLEESIQEMMKNVDESSEKIQEEEKTKTISSTSLEGNDLPDGKQDVQLLQSNEQKSLSSPALKATSKATSSTSNNRRKESQSLTSPPLIRRAATAASNVRSKNANSLVSSRVTEDIEQSSSITSLPSTPSTPGLLKPRKHSLLSPPSAPVTPPKVLPPLKQTLNRSRDTDSLKGKDNAAGSLLRPIMKSSERGEEGRDASTKANAALPSVRTTLKPHTPSSPRNTSNPSKTTMKQTSLIMSNGSNTDHGVVQTSKTSSLSSKDRNSDVINRSSSSSPRNDKINSSNAKRSVNRRILFPDTVLSDDVILKDGAMKEQSVKSEDNDVIMDNKMESISKMNCADEISSRLPGIKATLPTSLDPQHTVIFANEGITDGRTNREETSHLLLDSKKAMKDEQHQDRRGSSREESSFENERDRNSDDDNEDNIEQATDTGDKNNIVKKKQRFKGDEESNHKLPSIIKKKMVEHEEELIDKVTSIEENSEQASFDSTASAKRTMKTRKERREKEDGSRDSSSSSSLFQDNGRNNKKPKKKSEEEENDDASEDDDGLTELERTFLRAVATGNINKVYDCLNDGVNIHVKNAFER